MDSGLETANSTQQRDNITRGREIDGERLAEAVNYASKDMSTTCLQDKLRKGERASRTTSEVKDKRRTSDMREATHDNLPSAPPPPRDHPSLPFIYKPFSDYVIA